MIPPPRLPDEELQEAVDLAGDWSELRTARVFLTGATGFFGRWLLETLAHANRRWDLGVRAVVLTRDPETFLSSAPHLKEEAWLEFHQGDVMDFAPPAGTFTHILHGAASTKASDYRFTPEVMRRTITEGTRRVLSMAAANPIQRVLLVSSGAVYGPQPENLLRFPEDHPVPAGNQDPAQAYGQGKREAERMVLEAQATLGISAPIARCFAFVGPHLPLDQHFAIGNFLQDALNGAPIHVAGDGRATRSYLYASELAAWLWALLMRGGTRTYHVGSDSALTIKELAEQVAAPLGLPVQVSGTPTPGASPARYVPEITRVPEDLSLRPTVGLATAIERTLRWHRSALRNSGHSRG